MREHEEWSPEKVTQPRAYVIAHGNSAVVRDCVTSLKRHAWPYEISPAVDGRTITDQDWHKIGVRMSPTAGKLPRRPGAQGCWFSHWRLWNLCVATSQPMVILEHDAIVQGPWPTDLDFTQEIVKLYRTAPCKTKPELGVWSKGSHAYTVTPDQAQALIDRGHQWGASPVDKHIISGVIPWRFLDHDLVRLNPRRGPSTTSGL